MTEQAGSGEGTEMTKEVLVTVSGMQFDVESEEALESVSVGSYEMTEGVHRIRYEEFMMTEEGDQFPHVNILELRPDRVEVHKSGAATAHLVFSAGTRSETYYATPFGEIMIGMDTNQVFLEETEDLIKAKVTYSLYMNREFVSNCEINITIKAR